MKESKIKKIRIYKERDYNDILGNIQFWEESDENLKFYEHLIFFKRKTEITGQIYY